MLKILTIIFICQIPSIYMQEDGLYCHVCSTGLDDCIKRGTCENSEKNQKMKVCPSASTLTYCPVYFIPELRRLNNMGVSFGPGLENFQKHIPSIPPGYRKRKRDERPTYDRCLKVSIILDKAEQGVTNPAVTHLCGLKHKLFNSIFPDFQEAIPDGKNECKNSTFGEKNTKIKVCSCDTGGCTEREFNKRTVQGTNDKNISPKIKKLSTSLFLSIGLINVLL